MAGDYRPFAFDLILWFDHNYAVVPMSAFVGDSHVETLRAALLPHGVLRGQPLGYHRYRGLDLPVPFNIGSAVLEGF